MIPLFPGKVQEKMLVQTWRLDGEPTREETYRRVNHFLSSCRELGIPNPYSLQEIHQADQRWQHLHENAVPPLLDIQSDTVEPGESKNIRQAVAGKNIDAAEAEWDFD